MANITVSPAVDLMMQSSDSNGIRDSIGIIEIPYTTIFYDTGFTNNISGGITNLTGVISATSGYSGSPTLSSIYIGSNVTGIGDSAFKNCSILDGITIPNSVNSIGLHGFYGCIELQSIKIPDSVTTIGNGSFAFCSSLQGIYIPDSVEEIGQASFRGCTNLTSIRLPINDNFTDIAKDMFRDAGLTSITIPESVVSIGNLAFDDCDITGTLVLPANVNSIGNQAFIDNSITRVECLADPAPADVGNNVFQGNTGLTKIHVPRYAGGYGSRFAGLTVVHDPNL